MSVRCFRVANIQMTWNAIWLYYPARGGCAGRDRLNPFSRGMLHIANGNEKNWTTGSGSDHFCGWKPGQGHSLGFGRAFCFRCCFSFAFAFRAPPTPLFTQREKERERERSEFPRAIRLQTSCSGLGEFQSAFTRPQKASRKNFLALLINLAFALKI